MARALPLFALLLSGCIFQNISAEERLRDSVVGYNDETRWGRVDLAQQRVVPAYKNEFRATHLDWGRGIQIADSDIIEVQVADERDEAVSFVQVRWYRHDTMLLTQSVIRQQWERGTGGYYLVEESVVDGDDALLEPPFVEESEGDADEEEAPDEDEAELAVATP